MRQIQNKLFGYSFCLWGQRRCYWRIFEKASHQFQVVSKLPSLDVYSLGKAEECLRVTLGRLNIKKLSGYLIHSFEDFWYMRTYGELICLKSKVLSTRSAFHCIRRMILRFCLRKISRLISSRFPTVSLTADSEIF